MVLSWITVQEEFNLEFLDYDHEYMVETWVLSMLARHDLVIFVVIHPIELLAPIE